MYHFCFDEWQTFLCGGKHEKIRYIRDYLYESNYLHVEIQYTYKWHASSFSKFKDLQWWVVTVVLVHEDPVYATEHAPPYRQQIWCTWRIFSCTICIPGNTWAAVWEWCKPAVCHTVLQLFLFAPPSAWCWPDTGKLPARSFHSVTKLVKHKEYKISIKQ